MQGLQSCGGDSGEAIESGESEDVGVVLITNESWSNTMSENILDKRDRSLAPMPNCGPVDKAIKYRWAKPSSPGVFMQIDKKALSIDGRYQREKDSEEAVLRIARDWDWCLFGTLKVSDRGDDGYWVFDGGHRTRASFFRSDITLLPCMVFQLADIGDEARAFLAGARMSKAINSYDSFRASAVAMEPVAMRTSEILNELGISACKNTATRGSQLKCIYTIQKAVEINQAVAKSVLSVCRDMAGDQPVSGVVFNGLFTLVNHFVGRDILAEYEDTLSRLTQAEMEAGIRQMKAETGKGGQAIYAKGVMAVLNKGKKTKRLVW